MSLTVLQGHVLDKLATLPSGSVHCIVTSPPYWGLRDYKLPPVLWPTGWTGCHGLESTMDLYIQHEVLIFREVRRVLRDDGTLWLNLGDSMASVGKWGGASGGKNEACKKSGTHIRQKKEWNGLKPKDLCGIPWRVALALQADGWFLRCDIIWSKSNPMPESVTDRPTKAHEYLFLLTKQPHYYYDAEAVKEPVNGGAHARKANGANSRMVLECAIGRENSKPNPSRSNKTTPAGSGVQYNESFESAVTDLVSNRNKRSVWTIASEPFKGAHFATFPKALVLPCILAGTSARGCCAKCGAPWERIVENPILALLPAAIRKNDGDKTTLTRETWARVRLNGIPQSHGITKRQKPLAGNPPANAIAPKLFPAPYSIRSSVVALRRKWRLSMDGTPSALSFLPSTKSLSATARQ